MRVTPETFAIGERVTVTAGLAAGLTGVAEDRAKLLFGNMPMYAVRFPHPLGLRVIRADYLRRAS